MFTELLIVTLFSLTSCELTHESEICNNVINDDFNATQLILFTAPVNSNDYRRKEKIIVYWFHRHFINGSDTIAIYSKDKPTQPIMTFSPIKMSGVKDTNIKIALPSNDRKISYEDKCLGYRAAWFRGGFIRKTTCLSSHPNWMFENQDIFEEMSLIDLFIPGTHDSGAYSNDSSDAAINRYTITQNTDIIDQLIAGARYIDLRPAIYLYGYYVTHGVVIMNTMGSVVHQIKEFLKNTNEIVIVGFKEFSSGFNGDGDHLKFIRYLEKEFSDYICPRPSVNSWFTKLYYIWSIKKRLIISYDHSIYNRSQSVWPRIKHQWGNVQTITELREHLEICETQRSMQVKMNGHMRAAMAEITLTAWELVKNVAVDTFKYERNSLRQSAVDVGPSLTAWYNEEWPSTANIVAVDFINYSGIVEVAIEWNKRRSSECYEDYKRATSKIIF